MVATKLAPTLCVVALWMFVFCSAAESADHIGKLWRARGAEAAQRITMAKASAPNTVERCEQMLDFGYAMHAVEAKIVHKRDDNGWDNMHFLLNGSNGLFNLVYVYDGDGTLMATRVDHLPKDWRLVVMPAVPRRLGVMGDGCMFIFDLDKPFEASTQKR